MKTAKPTSNKPKSVTHHALSDLAMEAFAQTRVANREQAEAVVAKAKERLHKACVAELKKVPRGRAMLTLIPEGWAEFDRNYGDGDHEYAIELDDKSGGYHDNRLNLPCTPAMSRRLGPKLVAVSEAESGMRAGYMPDHRRAFVVEAVRVDAKAMIKIRAIVDKSVAAHVIAMDKASKSMRAGTIG